MISGKWTRDDFEGGGEMKNSGLSVLVLAMMFSGSVFAADTGPTAGGASSGAAPGGAATGGTVAMAGTITTTAIIAGVAVAGVVAAVASNSSTTTHH